MEYYINHYFHDNANYYYDDSKLVWIIWQKNNNNGFKFLQININIRLYSEHQLELE